MSTDCTLVTCEQIPALDPDDRLLAEDLRDRGLTVAVATWTDPGVDWSASRSCVLRSTWDYHVRYDEFLAWIDRVQTQTRLINSAPLLKWNAHKRYLRDLESAGVPVVPTFWLHAGERAALGEICDARGWESVVIKPARGAAAHDVLRVARDAPGLARGQAHVERLLQSDDVLVQAYLPSVETLGERALVFVDGRGTHAVVKKPFDTLLAVNADPSTLSQPAPEERAVAALALAAMPGASLYARIDLLHDAQGHPVVSELEVIEPTLYFGVFPKASAALADAIARELQ